MLKKVVTCMAIILTPVVLFAQDNENSVQSLPNYNFIDPVKSVFAKPLADPFLNFNLVQNPIPFGDVNGDGYNDFGFHAFSVWDNRTLTRRELVSKTAIYYRNSNLREANEQYFTLIVPVGDINGDGFADALMKTVTDTDVKPTVWMTGSEQGLVETDSVFPDPVIENMVFGIGYKTLAIHSIQLNQDSYLDALLIGQSGILAALFGDVSFADVKVVGTYLDMVVTDYALQDLDGDNMPEITVFGYKNYTNTIVFKTLKYDSELNEFSIYQDFDVASSMNTNIDYGDFNQDGLIELAVISSDSESRFFEYDSVSKKIDVLNPVSLPESYSYKLIGDVDADGLRDIAYSTGNESGIYLGKTGELNTIETDLPLSQSDFNKISTLSKRFKGAEEAGNYLLKSHFTDVKGKIDTAFYFSADMYKTETESWENDLHLLFMNDEVVYNDRILSTLNLSDLNNDGIEDFGVVYSNRGELHIHLGGSIQTEPDMVISLRESENDTNEYFMYSGIAVSDVNGDEFPDLILSSQSSNFVQIHLGSENGPAQNFSKRLEIFDSSKLVYWVENIGDINGDSFDEFVVSTLTNTVQMEGYPTKGLVKIVYGNSDLNNLTIKDISFEETGFTSYNHLYGYRVEPIGDFNGDTYNDFAISIRGDRMKSNHKTGAVAIFYGKQNVDDYVSADTTLYPVGKGSQIMFREFGFNMTSGGDFDGDGIDDIAIVGTQTGLNESIGEILFGGRNERALIYLPNALTFANSSLTTFVSSNYGGIYFVPDVNGDSKDELLITTGFNIFSNAGIIFGTNTTSEVFPTTVFKGFNSFDELGGAYHSAVGNFDGDSKTVEFILPQSIGNVEGFNAGSWSVYQLEKVTTKLDDSNEEIISFELKQNFPNPFNPATTIGFSVPSTSLVSLRIYNSIGQLVETLIQNASYSTGEYTVSFNASKLSSGVYFYELQTGAFKAVKAMTLIK